jgi:hypothetical protein
VSKRARVLGYGFCLILVLLGIVSAVSFGDTFGQVLTFVLISSGLVLATALIFYEVGLSEDREREREEARRKPKPKPPPPRPRPRLERTRGRGRRLR